MIITNEPHEILEVRPTNDNDSITLVQKRRASIQDEWNIKVIILNRREALAVRKAIEDAMLSLRPLYSTIGRR